MKALIYLLSCLLVSNSFATNLFKNGKLDDPRALNRNHAEGQDFINGWFATTNPNPTYFHTFTTSHASPRNQEGIIGLQVYKSKSSANADFKKREFIQGVFTEPLEAGRTYYLSFDLSLHESSKWSVSSLGLAFFESDQSVLNSKVIEHIKPDIHLANAQAVEHSEWLRYNVRYRAKGGERSLVFGSFGAIRAQENLARHDLKDGMHYSAFYYVDNFELSATMPEGGCFYQNQMEIAPPDRMTLVLDFSGSMRKNDYIKDVEASVIKSVQNAKPSDQILLVGFATSADVLYQGPQALLTKDSLRQIIERCRLSGSTNVYHGLKKAFHHMEKGDGWKDDQLLLISDGEFSVSARFQKLLAANNNRNVSFLHLGSKKAAENYAEIGIEYVAVQSNEIMQKVSDYFEPSLNAVSCQRMKNPTESVQYSIILDDSGSLDGNENDLMELLQALRNQMANSALVQVYRSSTQLDELIFDDHASNLNNVKIRQLIGDLDLNGGDEWNSAIQKSLGKRDIRYSAHQIIIVSDAHPLEEHMEGDMRSLQGIMRKQDAGLSALYLDELNARWNTYLFDEAGEVFHLSEEGSKTQQLEIEVVRKGDNGFYRYVANMGGWFSKKRSIRAHRRAHPLFRN